MPAPPGRSQHTVTLDPVSGRLLIFGGYSTAQGHLGDVWILDPTKGEVWQPSDSGEFPVKRRGHSAHVVGGKLWILGGANKHGVLSDAAALDLTTWEWTQVVPKVLPEAALAQVLALDNCSYFLLPCWVWGLLVTFTFLPQL
jgi:N-acetylneuraminic acid mutarotase